MSIDVEKQKEIYREKLRKKRIQVPKWIPDRLFVEFADSALTYGEEWAAQYVSKLKRELEIAELNRFISRS